MEEASLHHPRGRDPKYTPEEWKALSYHLPTEPSQRRQKRSRKRSLLRRIERRRGGMKKIQKISESPSSASTMSTDLPSDDDHLVFRTSSPRSSSSSKSQKKRSLGEGRRTQTSGSSKVSSTLLIPTSRYHRKKREILHVVCGSFTPVDGNVLCPACVTLTPGTFSICLNCVGTFLSCGAVTLFRLQHRLPMMMMMMVIKRRRRRRRTTTWRWFKERTQRSEQRHQNSRNAD